MRRVPMTPRSHVLWLLIVLHRSIKIPLALLAAPPATTPVPVTWDRKACRRARLARMPHLLRSFTLHALPQLAAACSFALMILFAPPVRAANVSAAEVLFDAGREAMSRNAYDEACLKFRESNDIDRAPGTVLNLANCEQKRGNVASAWEYFTQAMELLEPSDRRYGVAKQRAQDLEPTVPRLVVKLAADAPSNSVVRRSRVDISNRLGVPIRLDPGEHVINVEAPNRESAQYRVYLQLGDVQRLEVRPGPALTPTASLTPAKRETTTPETDAKPVPSVAESESSTWQWVLAGTSAGTLVAGGIFAALSYQEWTTVKEHCDLAVDPHVCDQTGLSAQSRGRDLGVTAAVLGGIGLLAGGAFILVATTGDSEMSVAPGHQGNYRGLTVRAQF